MWQVIWGILLDKKSDPSKKISGTLGIAATKIHL